MTGRARKSLIVTLTIAFVCLTASFIFAQQFGPGPGGGAGPGGTATTALTNFETTLFSGSGVCAFCHSNLTDSAGNDVSNDAHWRSTMMANAAKDPLWQAKIESEVNRNPHLQDCHRRKMFPLSYGHGALSGNYGWDRCRCLEYRFSGCGTSTSRSSNGWRILYTLPSS